MYTASVQLDTFTVDAQASRGVDLDLAQTDGEDRGAIRDGFLRMLVNGVSRSQPFMYR